MREEELIQEIRINDKYSHLGFSQYEKRSLEKESKPIISGKSILTSDYMSRLTKHTGRLQLILPPNCRHIERTQSGTIIIIEEPPALRTVRIKSNIKYHLDQLKEEAKLEKFGYKNYLNENTGSVHQLTLAFPYVIFIFFFTNNNEFHKGSIFLRTQQMSGFSDILFKMPMLNINSDQDVCFGQEVYNKKDSLYAAVQNAITVWWGAEFNHDYEENRTVYKQTPIIKNYLEWQYYSRENPMFIFNTDWIQHKKNIFYTLNYIKGFYNVKSEMNLNYVDMINLFSKSTETGLQFKPTTTSRKKYNLYYDISQSVCLNSNIYLSVGDPVRMKNGETALIYSFIGFKDGGDIKYVQLEKNGILFTMKYTSKFIKFMLDQIHKYRFAQSITLSNGVVIKPNDIIVTKIGDSKTYKKVEYIRKSRDNNDKEVFEIKCGAYYYFSDGLDAEKFDIKNPVIDNVKIEGNKDYLCIGETHYSTGLLPAHKCKFTSLDISSMGNLVAKFTNSNKGLKDSHVFGLNKTSKMPRILEFDEKIKPLPGVFRCGRKVFGITIHGESEPIDYGAWAYNGSVFYEDRYALQTILNMQIKMLIKDDIFFIQGPDFDTTFSIGDRVVVANWKKPIEVLNIKTIQGFKFDSIGIKISFILQSNDGKVSEEVYVSGKEGTIKTGYIRKVTNKFKKLSVGTKIIAKKIGIACFPKKDVNIVVAIIIDGPYEPLVLCSNGCTLWYSTIIADFQKISMKSKKWKTLNHVPLDLSKIKFQTGDIINGRAEYSCEKGYIINDPSSTRYLKVLPLFCYTTHLESQVFDKYFMSDAIFDCIPTPRISPLKQSSLGIISGFPDFHGGIIKDNHTRSTLKFTDERGGIDV